MNEAFAGLDAATLRAMLHQMLLIRSFEETAEQLVSRGAPLLPPHPAANTRHVIHPRVERMALRERIRAYRKDTRWIIGGLALLLLALSLVYYLTQRGFWFDLAILFDTVIVALSGRGAR